MTFGHFSSLDHRVIGISGISAKVLEVKGSYKRGWKPETTQRALGSGPALARWLLCVQAAKSLAGPEKEARLTPDWFTLMKRCS